MKPILDCFNYDIDKFDDEENRDYKDQLKSSSLISKIMSASVNMTESNCIDMDIYLQSLNYRTFEITFKKNKDYYISNKYGKYFTKRPRLDNTMYLKKIHEIKYINAIQNFEVFLGECYKVIFWFYPELLSSKDYENFKKYNGKNKLYERSAFLDRKVKKFIMNGDLTSSIYELYTVIGKENPFEEDKINILKLMCLNRNLIVHNLGIVNDIYLREVKNKNLSCQYVEGQYIFEGKENKKSITTYDGLDELLQSIADVIVKDIIERFEIEE